MLLVLVSIPLMVLAVAIATIPIIVAMRKEAAELGARQLHLRTVAVGRDTVEDLPVAA